MFTISLSFHTTITTVFVEVKHFLLLFKYSIVIL